MAAKALVACRLVEFSTSFERASTAPTHVGANAVPGNLCICVIFSFPLNKFWDTHP